MKMNLKWMIAGLWIAGAAFATADETLTIKGSDTFSLELGPPLISAFRETHPEVAIELTGLGSASGIAELLEDTCDLAASTRSLDETEQRMARSKGIELKFSIAGYYGLAVVVHADNPLKDLSDAAVRDVFTGKTTNWKQIGGPDKPIEVLIRDATGGSHLGFRELALDRRTYAAHAQGFASFEELVQAVADRPGAIGYVEMNLRERPGLHKVSINGIPPNEITVQKGIYPYVQPVWLYARAKSANPAIERFIQFVRSKPGQRVVETVGFVPVDLVQLDGRGVFFLVFQVLGGLALFIFGMGIMSDGLRVAAGAGLRTLLAKATANRFAGLALGTLLGFLVHSSAASVMLVGFLNAGLMSLAQAVAPMLGTNLGTSLSMQLVSFRLTDYAYVGIVAGLVFQMAAPNPRAKSIGRALIGFGLLFLGMKTMSAAIAPHRDLLRQYLVAIDGQTLSGRLLGVGLAFALTAIIQSSGATIGMAFALADAGVFDSLWQTYPIVIGAQIGTCATALLGSIGTGIDARRAAAGNLLTNVVNAGLSIALAPLWVPLFAHTSPDLVRQTANAHTLLMLQNCAVFLPIVPLYAVLLRKLLPSRLPPPEPSHLQPALLDYPEQAIAACLRELRRVARLALQSLRLAGQTILFAHAAKDVQTIRLNEQAVNEIKLAMKDYLAGLARRHLSKRQAILVQHVDRCMSDLERVGDHVETLCNVSLRRRRVPAAIVDRLSFSVFFQLYEAAVHVLKLLVQSFDPDRDDIPAVADQILLARDDYAQASQIVRTHFNEQVSTRAMTPAAGIFFAEYVAALDRIVRHARNVALAEKQPQFWIKRQKFEKRVGLAPDPALDTLVDPREFLPRLRDAGPDDPE